MLDNSRWSKYGFSIWVWISLLLAVVFLEDPVFAASKLNISKALWSPKTQQLQIKGALKGSTDSTPIELFDLNGKRLGTVTDKTFSFILSSKQLATVPCSIRARAGNLEVVKQVAGAPKDCAKAPSCKILNPVNAQLTANQLIEFLATAKLRDKKAAPLKYEWDFAGGSMGEKDKESVTLTHHRAEQAAAKVQFTRDNSHYRIRFSATDARQRRCEDSLEVSVGTPPQALSEVVAMAAESQDTAAKLAEAGVSSATDIVVLPYEEWSMQCASDTKTMPNQRVIQAPQFYNINALVYQKALRPAVMGEDIVQLTYSAASNPADPAGANSINSTSRNFPVGDTLATAQIKKSDMYETWTPPLIAGQHYYEDFENAIRSFMSFFSADFEKKLVADEGFFSENRRPGDNVEHGQYMPGIAAPYLANDPQTFSGFMPEKNAHTARWLPLTDIIDTGRVNPYPLFRVQATELDTQTPLAATDVVVTAGRDLHCRECHLKDRIGANSKIVRNNDGGGMGGGAESPGRDFYAEESNNIFDQEYAAAKNISKLHEHLAGNLVGQIDGYVGEDGTVYPSSVSDCERCHSFNSQYAELKSRPGFGTVSLGEDGAHCSGSQGKSDYSQEVHKLHAQMQYTATTNDILRKENGYPDKWWPSNGAISNPRSLFPVKDAETGAILSMEQNCLKCHAGQREQCYRDRMYTAGVTCYQCHGSLEAVANLFKKSKLNPDGNEYREPWFDEPECGACHIGNGNKTQKSSPEFFSAGVLRTAFEETDPAATPRIPDLGNPDAARFAVPLSKPDFTHNIVQYLKAPQNFQLDLQSRLFRLGKDAHGQVACGACHGAAHAIWPNRDPSANDNVTALQLQGHAGYIDDCRVCHTADAFADFANLDGGVLRGDVKEGILGGPHNMHPVNDENWWKSALGDTIGSKPRQKGVIKGGWHNDYAKIPGAAEEDQCAACHGNDHKGTRLSKTPVDREFINEKGKKIKVAAGTEIGCDLCHSVVKSCTDSPNPTCGKSSEQVANTTNLAPVFTSPAPTATVIGLDHQYQVSAEDPEGDAVHFELRPLMQGASIDENGLITIAKQNFTNALPFEYKVIATDSKGAYTIQEVKLTVDCANGLIWGTDPMNGMPSCQVLAITSAYPSADAGSDSGKAFSFSYQVIAKQASGLPIDYSLQDAPVGMSINDQGLLTWNSAGLPKREIEADVISFRIIANDSDGNSTFQDAWFSICSGSYYWRPNLGNCYNPIQIISQPDQYGLNVGDSFSYQVQASHDEGLSLKYSLKSNPAGMSINAFGLVALDAVPAVNPMTFEVVVRDSNGLEAKQPNSIIVCLPPTYWDANSYSCHSPITFTAWPDDGHNSGDAFSFQFAAEHEQGLPITFSLGEKPAGMNMTANGLVTMESLPAQDFLSFEVIATDTNGYREKQGITLLVCVAPNRWDANLNQCRSPAISITSSLPQPAGLNDGEPFSYQVTATHQGGLPLSYSLSRDRDEPLYGMKIDSQGLVTWKPSGYQYSNEYFGVFVTDPLGGKAYQDLYLTICGGDYRWNAESGDCVYLAADSLMAGGKPKAAAKPLSKKSVPVSGNERARRKMQARYDFAKKIQLKSPTAPR